VHQVSNLTSPPKTYHLEDLETCFSALITDKRLYVSGITKLHIFEVNTNDDEPLIRLSKIPTNGGLCGVYKILRIGDELLLGERYGYL
jgi:hypothetical protein